MILIGMPGVRCAAYPLPIPAELNEGCGAQVLVTDDPDFFVSVLFIPCFLRAAGA